MAVKIHLAKRKISLGVGDLVAEPMANGARVAGLGMWTRLALGREAHVAHQRAQAGLHEGYAREMAVRYQTTVDDFEVTIQGRIDGVYVPLNGGRYVIEEIKSVVVPPSGFAALDERSYPHYIEQLRLYCFLIGRGSIAAKTDPAGTKANDKAASRLCAGDSARYSVVGRLVFVNVADGATKEVEIGGPFDDCQQLVADRVHALIVLAQEEERRQEHRRNQSTTLRFPYDRVRPHQDEMMAAIERALNERRHLLVSAPAGVGKTAAALHPVVKYALAHSQRVFFVTAKNTQQQIVLETLQRMGTGESAHPSAVFFRARETMCINDVYACREEFCPHLRDYRLKLETTRIADRLLAERLIVPEAMMDAGRRTSLCPFELALVEAERTDVIVCDYNYVFDPQVYFRRFFLEADYSNAILVIDEAHNLVQRAMDYYSPSLSRQQIQDLDGNLRHIDPSLAKELQEFLEEIDRFFRSQRRTIGDEYSQIEDTDIGQDKYLIPSPRKFFDGLKPVFNKLTVRYLLDKTTRGRAIPDDPVDEFFSAFSQFCAVLAMEGDEFSYVYDTTGGEALKIVCKDPSRQLSQRLEGFHSVIAMSATLQPMLFYRQMLGFSSERTDQASFPSPFPKENRRIIVVPTVSTTFRARATHYGRIANVIATTAAAKPGNYMALFPSYDFLRGVSGRLPEGTWEVLVQEPKMTEQQRLTLLDAFREPQPPKLVLAVQGGLFAEGVDYPGETLSGVIIVSPALPQVSFERELMRDFYEAHYGDGFGFAYLYPGMNRVIQSVGRLIRSESDRGVAVLVCQRFSQTQYAKLFPPDWSGSMADRRAGYNLAKELAEFWGVQATYSPASR